MKSMVGLTLLLSVMAVAVSPLSAQELSLKDRSIIELNAGI